jgi:Phage integrase family
MSGNLPTQNAPSRFKLTTVANKVLVIKSLFSFGVKTGYLTLNVGSFLKTPKAKENLADRILDVSQVQGLIRYGVKNERDRLMLLLMYGCGLRVSEVVGLTWNNLKPHHKGEGKCLVSWVFNRSVRLAQSDINNCFFSSHSIYSQNLSSLTLLLNSDRLCRYNLEIKTLEKESKLGSNLLAYHVEGNYEGHTNLQEIEAIGSLVRYLLENGYSISSPNDDNTIGVFSPYRAQADALYLSLHSSYADFTRESIWYGSYFSRRAKIGNYSLYSSMSSYGQFLVYQSPS